VESVAWIAERKDMLSTLFGLLAIWAYARYAARPTVLRYLLVAVFFVLSLLSKPMLVTLPALLLLLDFWPLRRISIGQNSRYSLLKLAAEKLPLAALSIVSSIITLWAQRAGGSVSTFESLPLS